MIPKLINIIVRSWLRNEKSFTTKQDMYEKDYIESMQCKPKGQQFKCEDGGVPSSQNMCFIHHQ
jgi:hypothetical protein